MMQIKYGVIAVALSSPAWPLKRPPSPTTSLPIFIPRELPTEPAPLPSPMPHLSAPPFPKVITQANLSDFTYTDPTIGTLNFSILAPASFNFTLNITPTTELFSFDGIKGT